MCPRAYTVRPHVYMRTVLSGAGVNSSSVRVSVLYRRMRHQGSGRDARQSVPLPETAIRELAVLGAELHVAADAAGARAPGASAALNAAAMSATASGA